jgi:hypothetical protein
MALRFYGPLQELKDRLLPLGLSGEWEGQPHGIWKFRCKDKAGLLWSETKGTVWFDGPPAAKAALESKVEPVLADGVLKAPLDADSKIFVVHGRDHTARDQLELILHRLGLAPYVLQVTGGGGDTLIEALERMIGKTAKSASASSSRHPTIWDICGQRSPKKPSRAQGRMWLWKWECCSHLLRASGAQF